MSKDSSEIAGDITVSWLNALGSSLSAAPYTDNVAWNAFLKPDKIAEFYKTIYETVKIK